MKFFAGLFDHFGSSLGMDSKSVNLILKATGLDLCKLRHIDIPTEKFEFSSYTNCMEIKSYGFCFNIEEAEFVLLSSYGDDNYSQEQIDKFGLYVGMRYKESSDFFLAMEIKTGCLFWLALSTHKGWNESDAVKSVLKEEDLENYATFIDLETRVPDIFINKIKASYVRKRPYYMILDNEVLCKYIFNDKTNEDVVKSAWLHFNVYDGSVQELQVKMFLLQEDFRSILGYDWVVVDKFEHMTTDDNGMDQEPYLSNGYNLSEEK